MTAVSTSRTAPSERVGGAHTKRTPLRIGIMLRAIGEYDGAGVYMRALLDALLELDRDNEYVLFYSTEAHAGRYAGRPGVREVVVRAPGKLLWDQVAVPVAAWRERRGCAVPSQVQHSRHRSVSDGRAAAGNRVLDLPRVLSRRWATGSTGSTTPLTIPLFCRRATRVLTNSDSLATELERLAGVPPAKMATVYAAADQRFRRVTDPDTLSRLRARYELPDQPFFLMVVKGYARVENTDQALCPRKNVEGTLTAFARARAEEPACPPMVILGAGVTERLSPSALRERFGLEPERRADPRTHRARGHARGLQRRRAHSSSRPTTRASAFHWWRRWPAAVRSSPRALRRARRWWAMPR